MGDVKILVAAFQNHGIVCVHSDAGVGPRLSTLGVGILVISGHGIGIFGVVQSADLTEEGARIRDGSAFTGPAHKTDGSGVDLQLARGVGPITVGICVSLVGGAAICIGNVLGTQADGFHMGLVHGQASHDAIADRRLLGGGHLQNGIVFHGQSALGRIHENTAAVIAVPGLDLHTGIVDDELIGTACLGGQSHTAALCPGQSHRSLVDGRYMSRDDAHIAVSKGHIPV